MKEYIIWLAVALLLGAMGLVIQTASGPGGWSMYPGLLSGVSAAGGETWAWILRIP